MSTREPSTTVVADPYDIEEIFPEDISGPVRLPRRQAGSSPQGLAVTLLADYTLSSRAWLPSAAIVALLTEAGITPAGARTAISRLARRGVLEGRREGRRSSYRLTPAAAAFLTAGGSAIAAAGEPLPWDEQWTLIVFSLPQVEDKLRRGLRVQLRWMGFAPLYDGLWISPHELTVKAKGRLAELTLGALTVFRAQHVELGTSTGRDPMDAWDIAAIAGQYESFIRRWEPVLPRARDGRITGIEAVRARTEVMDTYRRLPIRDPHLPLRLLPPGWLRVPARAMFTDVYDGLSAAAENHVRTVANRYADGPVPGIEAHTVAALASGFC